MGVYHGSEASVAETHRASSGTVTWQALPHSYALLGCGYALYAHHELEVHPCSSEGLYPISKWTYPHLNLGQPI